MTGLPPYVYEGYIFSPPYLNRSEALSRKQVIKHSAAIQISNEVNILQRRAWNVLLANAFDDLVKKEIYEITLKDLARILRFESKNEKYLKETLKALNKTQVEWNILGKDGHNEWGVTTLLAEAKIINGICAYAYSPTLRQRLHNPEMYAKISLSLQNQFKSKHSLALYELFVDYFNIKIAYGETPQIGIEEFRKLLGLNEEEYKEFRDLNKFVIKKALKEINKISDLAVEVEYKKEGRRVVALKFRVKKNPQKENIIDLDEIEKSIERKKGQLSIPEISIANEDLLRILRNEFGISFGKAVEILKTQDEFYLEEVLESVREQIKLGKIKDVPAFTVKAIENDYRTKKPQSQKDKEREVEVENRAREEKDLIEKLQKEFERVSQAESNKILHQLSEDDKIRLQTEFERDSDNYTKNRLRRKGFDCVKTSFHCFITKKYLSEEFLSFELYAEKKGYNLVKNSRGEYEFVR
ncbi:MAG: RepB family plasmid replication initiator protein [Bacteroidota bacterium]